MKKALITGVTGQDGAYLAKFLVEKGYEVYGTYRRLSTPNFWRLQYLNVFEDINLIPAELIDYGSILEAVRVSEPDEIYHLAAQSFVGASFEEPIGTGEMTGLAVTRILEAIRLLDPEIKFYQASTSELYGNSSYGALNENSTFKPSSPYASAKLYGYWTTRIFREGYGIFASNGILFNHESPLRGLEFVTRKITNSVAKILHGLEDHLNLGNLDAERDWGYAPEYVESMWKILQHSHADDFVIATNEAHSVHEFVEKAFERAGLNWQDYVRVEKKFMRPLDVHHLQGDYSKAEHDLGWKPEVKFEKLVSLMMDEEISRWDKWINGERFPWDASNYPNENKVISRYQKIER